MKYVPELRFPEFKGEWRKTPLKKLAKRQKDKNTENKYSDVLTNSAVHGVIRQEDYFDRAIANESSYPNYYIVKENDFVYNPRISIHAPYGPIRRNKQGTGIMSPLYNVFSFKNEVSLDFIEHYFLTSKWYKYVHSIANYGARADRMNLTQKEFDKLPLYIPTLPEQEKIASFLTTIDDKINLLKEKEEALAQYKKGLMQQLFSQELRFKDEQGNDFPDWEEVRLKDILYEHKTRNKENLYEEVFSVAKEKGVVNQIEHLGRSYAADDVSNYKVIFPNDIVYTKSPTADFPYGIIKQNKTGRTGIVSTLYGVFKPTNEFVGLLLDYYFSVWENTFNYLHPVVEKGAKNTMNISNTVFLKGKHKLSFPTDEREQEKIASFLSSIDDKIALVQQELVHLEDWKRGLLQQMFV